MPLTSAELDVIAAAESLTRDIVVPNAAVSATNVVSDDRTSGTEVTIELPIAPHV